jgi:hypothetical protein
MKIDGIVLRPGTALLGSLVLLLSACTVYKDEGPDPAGKNQKVFVCHNGKESLQLDDQALRAHLNHGDSLGRCSAG